MANRSKTATISAGIGVTGLGLALLGPASIHLGLAAPIQGFSVYALGSVLGIPLAIGFGIAGLIFTRVGTGVEGRERAFVGLGAGALLLLVLSFAAGSGVDAPPIHDITTNIEDPPTFSDAVANAEDRANGVVYPDGGPDVTAQQLAAFPDLKPIRLNVPPAQALEASKRAAEQLGWTVTWSDAATGRMEAYDVTPVFAFVDDVAIRVRPDGSGSAVDLRSNSRVGGGDLGANYTRIAALREILLNE